MVPMLREVFLQGAELFINYSCSREEEREIPWRIQILRQVKIDCLLAWIGLDGQNTATALTERTDG